MILRMPLGFQTLAYALRHLNSVVSTIDVF